MAGLVNGVGWIDIEGNTLWPQLSRSFLLSRWNHSYLRIQGLLCRRMHQQSRGEGDTLWGKTTGLTLYCTVLEALSCGTWVSVGETRIKTVWGQGQFVQTSRARGTWTFREVQRSRKDKWTQRLEEPVWSCPWDPQGQLKNLDCPSLDSWLMPVLEIQDHLWFNGLEPQRLCLWEGVRPELIS